MSRGDSCWASRSCSFALSQSFSRRKPSARRECRRKSSFLVVGLGRAEEGDVDPAPGGAYERRVVLCELRVESGVPFEDEILALMDRQVPKNLPGILDERVTFQSRAGAFPVHLHAAVIIQPVSQFLLECQAHVAEAERIEAIRNLDVLKWSQVLGVIGVPGT